MVTHRTRYRQQPPRVVQPNPAPVAAVAAVKPVAPQAKAAKATVPKNAAAPARKKPHRRLLADASLARKTKNAKAKANPARFILRNPWVWVGNLDPQLTEECLQAHFMACGPISHVNIRYSGSLLPGNPEMGYRYALVGFYTLDAAHAATQLNGSHVHGSRFRLAVETTIDQLPEIVNLPHVDLDALRTATEGRRRCQIPMEDLQTASGVASPEALAQTRVWTPPGLPPPPPPPPSAKRRKSKMTFAGVSFKVTLA
ncbi:hypothetical protein B0H17DRAFT_1204675 [Mycena rosella]|uniref:RRM domain-containing protein n=1 Tax=Mycena rosella TaxID=1033263 RepID=A0AAD7D8W7_MYCRO|nr:hypothetical protein B0H17DRAFT_1204675 [Mycena rosella]